MHRLLNWSVIALFSSVFIFNNGCASLTGYQDGRTLGEGVGEAMISLNISQSPSFIDLQDSINLTDIPFFVFPNIEIGGRYGLSDKLDMTLRLNTNLNVGVGAKYQVVGDRSSSFALSVGAEVASFGFLTGSFNIQIPVFASYHPSDKWTFYASPRYIYQFSSVGDIKGFNYAGGNIGVLIGRKNKLGIDIGIYSANAEGTNNISLRSFGIGGKFVFGGNKMQEEAPTKSRKTRKS